MAILKDSFGNEISNLDKLGGQPLIDTRTPTQNIAAVNGEVVMDCAGTASVSFDVRGTFVATLVVEATVNGNDYFSVPFYVPISEFWATTITALGTWVCHLPPNCKRVRVRASAWTSGAAIVALRGSSAIGALYAKPIPTTFSATATAALSAAVTLTIPGAGVGIFHYITKLRISKYCGAALTAAAAPSIVTTTNINGTPSFDFKTLGAQGDKEEIDLVFTNPLKSLTAGSGVTIVCPVLTGAIWKVTAFWYAGA